MPTFRCRLTTRGEKVGLWRYRVGAYRVVCAIEKGKIACGPSASTTVERFTTAGETLSVGRDKPVQLFQLTSGRCGSGRVNLICCPSEKVRAGPGQHLLERKCPSRRAREMVKGGQWQMSA
jgi:hypothetical protein